MNSPRAFFLALSFAISSKVWGADISYDGQLLATGSTDTTCILWDLETSSLLGKYEKTSKWVLDFTFPFGNENFFNIIRIDKLLQFFSYRSQSICFWRKCRRFRVVGHKATRPCDDKKLWCCGTFLNFLKPIAIILNTQRFGVQNSLQKGIT